MQWRRSLSFVTILLAGVIATSGAAGIEKGRADSSDALDQGSLATDGTAATAETDDAQREDSTAPLSPCSLEIITEPPGASVILDGKQSGVSPLLIDGIDAGEHTLQIKKTGYYQKKAVVLLPPGRKTTLQFKLSAPGRLTIVTVPPAAAVSINGERKGKSPYVDSLMKPGVYLVMLEKEHYQTIADSITVPSGGRVSRIDTLRLTQAYGDSLKQAAILVQKKRKRIGFGTVAGAFALFLLTLAVIELRE